MINKYSMLTPLSHKILYICKHEYKFFLSKANVVGVGLSYKITNGFNTLNECIRVFVTKKISKNKLSEKDLIPSFYKSIQTDIVENGSITGLSLTTRVRPIPGGYSISPTQGLFGGTLGCLVFDGSHYYVLSNNHVLASCNVNPLGVPVVQPSRTFGGTAPGDTVAYLSKYIPIQAQTHTHSPENYVDCAMARITDPHIFYTKLALLGAIHDVSSTHLGQFVQKVGCATEVTHGQITTLGATCLTYFNNVPYLFLDQILTTHMASSGDSGSVLLDNNMNVLGLIMSGNSSSTSCTPISYVICQLNVAIVTG